MKKSTKYLMPFSYAKLRTILVIAGSTIVAAMDVGIRKRTGDLIDLLGQGRVAEFAFLTFGLMVCAYIILSFTLPYIKTRLSDHIQEAIHTRLYQKTLTACQGSLDTIDAGTVGTYFTSDAASIVQYVNRITGIGLPDVFTFLISFLALMVINPWVGLATVLSAVIPVITMLYMSRILVDGHKNYQQSLQQTNEHIARHFFNLEFVKASRLEDALERENATLLQQLLVRKKSITRNEALLSFPMMLSSFITILMVVLLGGFFVSKGELSVGELFSAISLVDFIVNPVMRFDNTIRQVRRAAVNITRLNNYFEMPDAQTRIPEVVVHSGDVCKLDIKNLKFSYPNAKPVLNGVNFFWEQGKLNVLAGGNGTGKSTLLKILTGVYEAQEGTVSICLKDLQGNKPLSDYITVDTQKTVLFADTVYHNLTLGQKLPLEKVRKACRCVGLDDEIMAMSEQYDTKLGADGNPLSGGQKRRLCVARTLLRESNIYIFDEPTAAVDPANIDVMTDTLRNLSREKLVIVITHEQALIETADTVTRLEAIV